MSSQPIRNHGETGSHTKPNQIHHHQNTKLGPELHCGLPNTPPSMNCTPYTTPHKWALVHFLICPREYPGNSYSYSPVLCYQTRNISANLCTLNRVENISERNIWWFPKRGIVLICYETVKAPQRCIHLRWFWLNKTVARTRLAWSPTSNNRGAKICVCVCFP